MSSEQFKLLVVMIVVSGLVGGLLGSWLLPGRAAFAGEEALQVVTAREFRVLDEEGKLRARLGWGNEGVPGLSFYDAAGEERVVLVAGEDHAALGFNDAAGKPRASLAGGEFGFGLSLYDAAGRPRVWLALEKENPVLALGDVLGKEVVLLSQGGPISAEVMLQVVEGEPALILSDAVGKPRATLHLKPGGQPGLTLTDEAGNVRAMLGSDAVILADERGNLRGTLGMVNGQPLLALTDIAGNERLVLGSYTTKYVHTAGTEEHPVSSILLFGETGRVIWQAP